jgi:ABC-type uncharacterized transport system substrate-binding protein
MSAITRRRFLAATSVLLVAPLALRGQGRAPHRIGMLPDCEGAYCTWFQDAMRQLGWREGRDFVLVKSGLSYGDRIELAAQRIVAAKPDLIYTIGTAYVLASRRRTTSIPIVMWASGYPVEAGFAKSLARPGLNVTGLSLYAGTEVFGKLLQYLREVRPGIDRVGILWSYVPPFHPVEEVEPCYRALRAAGARLGMAIHISELAQAEHLDAALRDLQAFTPQAVIVTSGTGVWPVRQQILRYALARGWPTMSDSPWRPDDELKPLMSYGPSSEALIRQTVPYALRILRDGATAGELPIQQPAKFELTVDLATAQALGLSVPTALLMRADRITE